MLVKPRLTRTGETLLAIGGAFVPLNVFTLGQEKLLNWDPSASWLVASLLSVPVHLAFHALLRDRAFAALAAVAGASELLSVLNWIGVPLEWNLCALLVLGLVYQSLSSRLTTKWGALARALFLVAQVTAPLVMLSLFVGGESPDVWETTTGRPARSTLEYAIMAAWWLGSAVYVQSARLFGRRRYGYLAAYLIPVAYGLTLLELEVDRIAQPLAWAALSVALLAAAELAARRTGEARRSLRDTVLGLGSWRSCLASPLFSSGYVIALLSLGLSLARYWASPTLPGARELDPLVTIALLFMVAICVVSAASRRTSLFLYAATWLLPLPFMSTVASLLLNLGLPVSEHQMALALAVLEVGYLLTALALDRFGGHYAKPAYLGGYALSLWTVLISSLDRLTQVQLLGLSLLVYGGSAWLVHHGRHPSYVWVVRRLFGSSDSAIHRTARALFIYLVASLLPAWLLLAISLREAAPDVAHYGLALALLAHLYVVLGLRFRRVETDYRRPWYIVGYVLSVTGPMLAAPDPTLRAAALALSIALYLSSAEIFHRSSWLYPVALLTPVLVA